MLSFKKIFFAFAICFSINNISAQSTSSPDCVTAPTICGNTNLTFVSSSGAGSFVDYSTSTTISNPQNSPVGIVPPGGNGCHLAGELNPNFFIFTCQTAGTLEFDIASGPGVQMGCYDWIMWPYTAATCSGISGNTLPPTRCCWNAACSGGTGIASAANLPAGASANNFCAPVNVNCGDRFIVCISNYSGVNATVPVKFIGTAIISCVSVGTPLVANNATICSGGTATLIVTGGTGTATWTPGPSVTNTLIVSPVVTTTYTATKPGGCGTGTIAAVVNVIPTPTITATNNSPVCAGSSFTLFGTGGGTYSWSGPGGYTSALQNPVIGAATTAMSGNYTLTVSNGACTTTAVTSVVVNASSVANASSNSPVCAGQAINFTGTGGGTYSWTGPVSFSSTLANPSIPVSATTNSGNYVLTVTAVGGCTSTAIVNVVVNPLPTIVVANPTTCVNTTINLTSNGGVTYSWTGPGGFNSNLQNPNIPLAQIPMSGVYVVTVTDANGCVNTANANVSVLPVPSPNITSNSPVCAGGTLNLFGSGGATYSWSGPGYTGPTQNPTINNVTAVANGVYTLLVASGTCTASITYTVVINPVPVFNFTDTNVLCNGQSNGTSNVNVTAGTGPFTYQWTTSPVQNSANATALPAGTYSCTVTDANGCVTVASTQITQPTPFLVAINSATFSACAGSPINAIANGSGGTGPYTYN